MSLAHRIEDTLKAAQRRAESQLQTQREAAARRAVGMLDLTTLESTDTEQRVRNLCGRAIEHSVAAVCVFPRFVAYAAEELRGHSVDLAAVAMAFPHGQLPIELRLAEVQSAVSAGCNEIDMVISRGEALEGRLDVVASEIQAARAACGDAHLKVILETCDLGDNELIYDVSRRAIDAGAHFLKTSTGKGAHGAKPEHAALMLTAIADSGEAVGFKAAGGVRSLEDYLIYESLHAELLGEDAVHDRRFRVGASSLLDALRAIAPLQP